MSPPRISRSENALWIQIWFAIDAILSLAPPVYWAASGSSPFVMGMPLSIFYFLFTGLCITASIMAAYAAEVRNGNFTSTSEGG